MKLNTLYLVMALLIVSACKNTGDEEAKTDSQQENVDTLPTDPTDNEKMQYADLGTEERKENVEIEQILGSSLEEWQSQKAARLSLDDLKSVPKTDIPAVSEELKENVAAMRAEIPEERRTEEVEQNFELVLQKIDGLHDVLEEEGVNEEKIYAQVEKVIQAYEQLEEKLGSLFKNKNWNL